VLVHVMEFTSKGSVDAVEFDPHVPMSPATSKRISRPDRLVQSFAYQVDRSLPSQTLLPADTRPFRKAVRDSAIQSLSLHP
jgi:hypothetical protein